MGAGRAAIGALLAAGLLTLTAAGGAHTQNRCVLTADGDYICQPVRQNDARSPGVHAPSPSSAADAAAAQPAASANAAILNTSPAFSNLPLLERLKARLAEDQGKAGEAQTE